jgi:circadian clock protein KaiC
MAKVGTRLSKSLTGIQGLDEITGGGLPKGRPTLVCGSAGCGKTLLAILFAVAACQRGERALYFSFEESPSQITRNMRSIGVDLDPWVQKGLLKFQANRPTFAGLEMHVMTISKAVSAFKPQVVIFDPLTSFVIGGNENEVKMMVMRLLDLMKSNKCTALFTSLILSGSSLEQSQVHVAPLIDTWLLLRDIEIGGERNRGAYILKSRGMAHTNQIREFLLTDHGVELRDVYVCPSGVLTGSARLVQEAQEKAMQTLRDQEVESRQLELERKRTVLEAQIAGLRAEFAVQEIASLKIIGQEQAQEAQLAQERTDMGLIRKADAKSSGKKRDS